MTQGSWPNEFNDGSNVQFPREFSDIVRSFEAFYKKKFSGRVLQWLSTLSTVEIAGCFSGQTYIFHVNVLQYSILEPLVNSDIPISLDELMGRIPDRNKLVEVLDQLLIAGLVLKSDDKFTINSGFQHASHDVILCHYLAKASGRPTEQADQTIERSTDRGPLIQATIMRYMKVAKESAIGTLIDNVADLLAKRLVPDRAEIEKALELLVVREFLRKDPKKRSIVHFVP